MMAESTVVTRFVHVMERFEEAIRKSGRKRDDIRLVAVSKWHAADKLVQLAEFWAQSGTVRFGESYMQEALAKQDNVARMLSCSSAWSAAVQANPQATLEWHFIGHLQSRKAKDVTGRFSLIHSVDSLKVAGQIHKARIVQQNESGGAVLSPQAILIQVNIGREEQKSGVLPEDIDELFEGVRQFSGIDIQGLMCLPPASESPEDTRQYFCRLRLLKERLESTYGVVLPELSMGMSSDFPVAIEEGATLVRIGTDIFGARE